ncbi:MAG: extracellular solute-binding protein [Clostridia bacterium]|nr:extracellular solute-binding protein [Clostridia bacterium]
MKRRRIPALLLTLCLLLSLLAGCGSGGAEAGMAKLSMDPDKASAIPFTGEVVYQAEDWIEGLFTGEDGIYLRVAGRETRMDDSYQPTDWESAEDHVPDARYKDYAIREGKLYRNEKEMKLPLDEDDRLLGFWDFDGIPYLVARQLTFDPAEIDVPLTDDTVLIPLGKKAGDPVPVEGLTLGYTALGSDGNWNYYTASGTLYRTDGKNIQDLGALSLSGVDVNDMVRVCPVPDGVLVSAGSDLFLFTQATEEDLATTEGYGNIVIGVVEIPSPHLTEMVAKYNMASPNKVEVRSYNDQTQLNMAVLSGEVDMVGSWDYGVLLNYAKQDYLEPLDNVIGDLLSSGALMENIVDAGKYKGTSYIITDLYKIYGMLLPTAVVEEAGGRFDSMSDLIDTLNNLEVQNYQKQHTKEIALNNFLFHGVTAWVDDEANTCNFQDENFMGMLEICNQYAKDQDEVFANESIGRALFNPCWSIMHPSELGDLQLYYEIKGTEKPFTSYGLPGTLFPSPTQQNTGLTIKPDYLYCVMEQSEKKQSCADFLNWYLSDEIQQYAVEQNIWGLPVRRETLQRLQDTAHDMISDQWEDAVFAAYKTLVPLAESADHYAGYKAINSVIEEEALRYFAGDITVEQAAEYVQNRVSLYLAEQS